MTDKKIIKFVKKLIELTNQDRILWQKVPVTANGHWCALFGWKISTELIQDGPPELWIDSLKIGGRWYHLQELNSAIDLQYRRGKFYEYSPETELEKKQKEEKFRKEEGRRLKEFAARVGNLMRKIRQR